MFTLAHLSDPHLAPLPAPHWSELLGKRVTGYINWQRKRRFIHEPVALAAIVADIKAQSPDHIAVTGDIANIALAAEFPRGRNWLESLGTAHDVTVVPGNHDVYVREAANFATRQWGPYMCDDDGVEGFPFVRRRNNVVLIGLSTGVPTAPFLATGWLGTRQLIALTATLKKLKNEDLFRVILIHHPPGHRSGSAQASVRCSCAQTHHRRSRRRIAAARPRSPAHDQLAGWTGRHARTGGRRAFCIGSAGQGQGRARPTISTGSTARAAPGNAN